MKVDGQLFDDLYWDDEDAFDYLPRIKGLNLKKKEKLQQEKPRLPRRPENELVEQFDNLRRYDFTYDAARFEEWWLLDSLGPFYDEQWFDDVLRVVKGGKEASVYLCRANPSADSPLIAAKVYRPRSLRNLRKDHIYREGRDQLDQDGIIIRDRRMSRAMAKRTDFGQELMHKSWIEHEFRTIKILHDAGCDLPIPLASGNNAILMNFIGDEELSAPTLSSVHLQKPEAQTLFERVCHNVDLMLVHERVHGDLSAYNILYWEGEISLIDFPQAINPNRNPNAYPIFQRDMTRICEYFITKGVQIDPIAIAEEMWIRHGYSTAPNIYWPEEEEDE